MSFTAASDDTAPRVAEATASNLRLRVISAAVLIPVAVALVALGGWWFTGLVAVVGVLMANEWDRLTGGTGVGSAGVALAVLLLAAVLLTAAGATLEAMLLLLAAIPVLAILARWRNRRLVWPMLGVLWLGLPCIAAVWLRQLPDVGLEAVLWVLVLVWASDSGAYAAGRGIGGPKLAPRISPNKTWAGLAGGVIGAAVVGAVAARTTGLGGVLELTVISAVLAAFSQVGDLAESALKRHFSVKDSGALIPGHGGILDRLDALLFVLPAAAILVWLSMGGAPEW